MHTVLSQPEGYDGQCITVMFDSTMFSFNLGIMLKLVDSGWPAAMMGSGGPTDFARDASQGHFRRDLKSPKVTLRRPPLLAVRCPPLHRIQDPASETVSRGVQQASPTIPREFCDEIVSVLSNLPDEWPLIKIDMILSKVGSFYVSWRRFLYLDERLRTLDPRPAARTFSKNKDRILAHLVQVISEWIVSSIEPAKEMTRSKEPEFMFLHTKDFWFRSIWIDLHQALTIDRASSRDRAPVGLVRCVCKDDQVKGPNAPIKQYPCFCSHLDGPLNPQEFSTHC